MQNLRECHPMFPCLKHLQAIDPSVVAITKQLNNEIEETFCEELELRAFRDGSIERILKTCHFFEIL